MALYCVCYVYVSYEQRAIFNVAILCQNTWLKIVNLRALYWNG